MSFLDTFKLYDRAMPDEQDNLQIIAECYYYKEGSYSRTDDGRVNCVNELIQYDGDNAEEYIISLNNNTFGRLLNDEQLILGYLEENPDSPKYKQQKKYISDIKSYFRYWYNQKGIKPPEKGFYHSGDFRTLRQDGIEYYPTANQAEIIKLLYNAYLYGTPELSQNYIITLMESDRETSYRNVREYFKTDNESKALYRRFIIKGHRKGSIRINLN